MQHSQKARQRKVGHTPRKSIPPTPGAVRQPLRAPRARTDSPTQAAERDADCNGQFTIFPIHSALSSGIPRRHPAGNSTTPSVATSSHPSIWQEITSRETLTSQTGPQLTSCRPLRPPSAARPEMPAPEPTSAKRTERNPTPSISPSRSTERSWSQLSWRNRDEASVLPPFAERVLDRTRTSTSGRSL